MTDLIQDPVVGIAENPLADMVMAAYPNPTSGSFNLSIANSSLKEAMIELINIQGKKVYSEHVFITGAEWAKAYQPNLPSGLYFLRLNSGNYSRSIKLMIE